MGKGQRNGDAKAAAISDAEWQVAKVLWKKSPLTAAEIIEALRPGADWNPKTIHTLIRRLTQKKIIAAEDGVTPYTYYPLVSEGDCKREKTRLFVDKIYDGSVSLMISQFVKNKMLSQKEIDELKDILNGK